MCETMESDVSAVSDMPGVCVSSVRCESDDDEVEEEEMEEDEIAQEQELGLVCGPQESRQHDTEEQVKTCKR